MNSFELLRLWRERWGLAGAEASSADYVAPGSNSWEWRLTHARFWSLRGLPLLIGILALLLLLPAALIVFPPAAQAFTGLVMLSMAFYVRRHVGMLPFMVLSGLALLAVSRYLSWRLQYTLPINAESWPSLLVWLAELYLAVNISIWIASYIWPLFREQDGMNDAPSQWPYIDLLLQADDNNETELKRAIQLAAQQQWPIERLTLYYESPDLDNVHAIAQARGAIWLGPCLPQSESLARLPRGNGEYVMVVKVGPEDALLADSTLLQFWVAWMRRDPNLVMLHSAGHAAASAAPRMATRLLSATGKESIAIIRRSAWTDLKAVAGTPINKQLERAGKRTAIVGHPDVGDTFDTPHGLWRRIDDQWHAGPMHWRRALHLGRKALRVGAPVAWTVLACALLAIPLFQRYAIHAPFGWYAAYLFPALVLLFLVWQRSQSSQRLSPWIELREWMLAASMPLVTTISTAIAWRQGLHAIHPRSEPKKRAPLLRWLWRISATCGLIAGLWRLPGADEMTRPWLAASCLVLLYSLLLETSRWAVRREADLLQSLQTNQRRMPALLRLPDGHLMPCTAVDFPADPLTLRLPEDAALDVIGHGFTLILKPESETQRLSGEASRGRDHELRFRVASESRIGYADFVRRMRTRILGPQYWLPGRQLDQWMLSLIGMTGARSQRANPFS